MSGRRRGWRRWAPAAGTAAGLWLCTGGPAAASPAADGEEAAARTAQPTPSQVRASAAGSSRWQSLWGSARPEPMDPRLARPEPFPGLEPGDLFELASDVLRHGVRYERPMSMIDVPVQVGVRAPGSGSSIVTVEVKF